MNKHAHIFVHILINASSSPPQTTVGGEEVWMGGRKEGMREGGSGRIGLLL